MIGLCWGYIGVILGLGLRVGGSSFVVVPGFHRQAQLLAVGSHIIFNRNFRVELLSCKEVTYTEFLWC